MMAIALTETISASDSSSIPKYSLRCGSQPRNPPPDTMPASMLAPMPVGGGGRKAYRERPAIAAAGREREAGLHAEVLPRGGDRAELRAEVGRELDGEAAPVREGRGELEGGRGGGA